MRLNVLLLSPLLAVIAAGSTARADDSERGVARISVSDDGRAQITVRSGEADIYTPRGSEALSAGKTMLVQGTPADPEFQVVRAVEEDEFDGWNRDRDHYYQNNSKSYQYVSRDIYG